MDSSEAPYSELSPQTVLDAIEAVGHRCDGRVLALNSYENRVYQIGIEEDQPVVAKFYRPARWSDAAIREEHAFAGELAAQEIPVVAPLLRDGVSLHVHRGFRYAVFPRRGGRWPELGVSDDREWVGRFLGRIHAVGRAARRAILSSMATGCPTIWLPSTRISPMNCWTTSRRARPVGAGRSSGAF